MVHRQLATSGLVHTSNECGVQIRTHIPATTVQFVSARWNITDALARMAPGRVSCASRAKCPLKIDHDADRAHLDHTRTQVARASNVQLERPQIYNRLPRNVTCAKPAMSVMQTAVPASHVQWARSPIQKERFACVQQKRITVRIMDIMLFSVYQKVFMALEWKRHRQHAYLAAV